MRQRLVALAAAATLAATAAAPAFADGPAAPAFAGGLTSSAFACKANASLTENGNPVYNVSRAFVSTRDLSGSYSTTYAFNGITYVVSASVSCTK